MPSLSKSKKAAMTAPALVRDLQKEHEERDARRALAKIRAAACAAGDHDADYITADHGVDCSFNEADCYGYTPIYFGEGKKLTDNCDRACSYECGLCFRRFCRANRHTYPVPLPDPYGYNDDGTKVKNITLACVLCKSTTEYDLTSRAEAKLYETLRAGMDA